MAEFLQIRDLSFEKVREPEVALYAEKTEWKKAKRQEKVNYMQGNTNNLILPQARGREWQSGCLARATQDRDVSTM